MRGFPFPKIGAGLRAGYQLWGSISEKADIHRKDNYCVHQVAQNSNEKAPSAAYLILVVGP
jgi:hypothetical protein